MIFTSVITFALSLLSNLTSGLEQLHFTIDEGFYEVLGNYISCAMYFIPYKELAPIVVFVLGMFLFRGAVAVIKAVWDLLPFF